MTGADEALVLLQNAAGDTAAVSLHGAQLLSWRPAGAEEQSYCSPSARPAPGKALRGGTPVCFPQFADRGPLPKHGFARTSRWELVSAPTSHAPVAEARFQLDSASASFRWDHAFCLVLVVRLAASSIELELQAANTGHTAYEFTAALHTYLAVQDVRRARVLGLQGLSYEDNLQGLAVKTEGAAALAFDGEIDRVYRDVPQALELRGEGASFLRVSQQGFGDVVVWNPGPDKAARLGDMPAQDWLRMLCLEAGAIHRPVQLAPGKTWRGLQRLERVSP